MARAFKVLAVHDKMWSGTFNFRAEADGTSGTDIDLVDEALGGGSTTMQIISNLGNHKKILELYDNDGSNFVGFYYYFSTAQTSNFTFEFWHRTSDVTKLSYISFREGATNIINCGIQTSQYYHTNGGATNIKAISNDTWYHHRFVIDFAGETFDWYIDGVLEADDAAFDNSPSSEINRFRVNTHTATSTYYVYIDAVGFSWDADYKIGDNVHWRHYFDQDSDFESHDVGDTDITGWSETTPANTTITLIQEFNEHKKILDIYDNSGVGFAVFSHTAPNEAYGTIEFLMKTDDATDFSRVYFTDGGTALFWFLIYQDKFQYYNGGYNDVGLAAIDNTWYYIRIDFECTTGSYQGLAQYRWHVYINNIQYGPFTYQNDQAHVDNILFTTSTGTSGFHFYLDAISFSWNNDIGDNRLLDYNPTYTSEDITTDIINVKYKNQLGKWREAIMTSKETYEASEIFLQVYDINSKMAMEASLKKRDQLGEIRTYILRDKNQDDLENVSSNTFTADDIHDPTDSTSMLKVILPNVSEIDGDLILVNADTKTDTYSPTTKNYPDHMMLRDIGDLADSVVIISANGKCYLDDDKASGTALDLDVAADKSAMTDSPLISDILETINYFEIFGAINPDTGARFSKIIDNTGSDKKRSWRITNNNFKTQADVDGYAAKLEAKSVPIRNIAFWAQSLGSHDMGETLNYKFVNSLYKVPVGDYYIIFESIDFDANKNSIVLSEGLVEESQYAATYERETEYNDTYAGQIYETDIVTVYPEIHEIGGSGWGTGAGGKHGIVLNAAAEGVISSFYFPSNIDDSRDATIDMVYTRDDANNDIFAISWGITRAPVDGSAAWANVDIISPNMPARASGRADVYSYTLDSSDIDSGYEYQVAMVKTAANRDQTIQSISITYKVKRG